MSWDYLITSLIVVASPGTGVLITLAAALSRGRQAAIIAALGCTIGIVPHMLAAITGLAALLHTSALAFQVLKYAGAAYLLYMAWMTVKEGGALRVDPDSAPVGAGRMVLSAALANLLNPKLSIFFLAFLPQFIDPAAGPAIGYMVELSLVFMAMTFVIFVLYGLVAAQMRDHVLSRPTILRWLRRSFAAAFVALGGKLALSESR